MPLPFLAIGAAVAGVAAIGTAIKNRKQKQEIRYKDEQIDYQQEQIDSQHNQINRKNEQIAKLKQQIAELEAALKESLSRERVLTERLDSCVQERKALNEKIERILLVIQRLELDKQELQQRIAFLEKESQRFVNRILFRSGKLRTEAGYLGLESNTKDKERQMAGAEMQLHQNKIADLDAYRQETKAELSRTAKQIEDMRAKKTSLEREIGNY